MGKKNKHAKFKTTPIVEKKAKFQEPLSKPRGEIIWSFKHFDDFFIPEGASPLYDAHYFCCKLRDLEQVPWNEHHANSHSFHFVSLDGFCAEAQKRLIDINQDHNEGLWSFRCQNKHRIWGVAGDDGCFFVIWWDPFHKICPVDKKHT